MSFGPFVAFRTQRNPVAQVVAEFGELTPMLDVMSMDALRCRGTASLACVVVPTPHVGCPCRMGGRTVRRGDTATPIRCLWPALAKHAIGRAAILLIPKHGLTLRLANGFPLRSLLTSRSVVACLSAVITRCACQFRRAAPMKLAATVAGDFATFREWAAGWRGSIGEHPNLLGSGAMPPAVISGAVASLCSQL